MEKIDLFESKNLSDQSRSVIMAESELYFADKEKYSYELKYNVVLLKSLHEENKIVLRGDNLITRKQMYNRVFKRQISEEQKPGNNNDIYSFILMPHIKNSVRCQINSKRASCAEYNDNPFVFFAVLKNLYINNFEIQNPDKVELHIINSKPFWETFGLNLEGYKKYLEVFCLRCLDDLMAIDKYKVFFKKYNKKLWEGSKWEDYNKLLEDFSKLRKAEILQKRNGFV